MSKAQLSWKKIIRFILENLTVFGLIIILIIFNIGTGGRMLTAKNLVSMLTQSFYLMLGCISVTFLFAQGGLDLTMGNTIGFVALIAARFASISIWLSLAICIGLAICVSLLNGFLHAKLQLPIFIAGLSVSFVLGGGIVASEQ